MEMSFATEEVVAKGEKQVRMNVDVFIGFFNEIVKYKKVDELLLKEINKRYSKAQKIKRTRIRLKKEKEVLVMMYNILFAHIKVERG